MTYMGIYCVLVLYMNYVINYSCVPYVIPISEAEIEAPRGEVTCPRQQLVSVREGIRTQSGALPTVSCCHPGTRHPVIKP